jgi:hypothetical protein
MDDLEQRAADHEAGRHDLGFGWFAEFDEDGELRIAHDVFTDEIKLDRQQVAVLRGIVARAGK